MQNPKGFIAMPVLIIAVIIAGLAAGGSWWYVQNKEEEAADTNTAVVNANVNTSVVMNDNANTNTLVNSNANVAVNGNTNAATDATAGWKTYTNETYKYSIKHPANWKTSESSDKKTVQLIPPDASGKTSLELGPNLWIGLVDTIVPEGRRTLTNGAIEDNCVQKNTSATINGIAVIQQNENCFATYHATYFPRGSQYIRVTWAEVFDDDYVQYPTILSTFTFLDGTASWKTYTNTKYSYRLKYPSPWSIDAITDEEVVFGCGRDTECHDAVKVTSTPTSLAAWKASFDQTIIIRTSNITVDGQVAMRIDTGEFSQSYVGIIYDGKLYVISGNSFLDRGLLTTFTFTK